MNSHRSNPEGEANQKDTKQNEREVFAAKMEAKPQEQDDYFDAGYEEPACPTCGGDGTAEYNDCPEAWGEDCPSEMNHLITCPNCRGSGLLKDCSSC